MAHDWLQRQPHVPTRADLARFTGTNRLSSVRYTGYGDAAGTDDWSGPWYIAVMVYVRGSHRWKQYRQWHQAQGGHLHLSERGIGPKQRHVIIESVFNQRPFDFAHVVIVDTAAYKRSLAASGAAVTGYFPAWHVWGSEMSKTMAAPVLLMTDVAGERHSPIRELVLNHPGHGHYAERMIIERVHDVWQMFVPLRFVAGGDPGIDLADVIAWTMHRAITRPHDDLPAVAFTFRQVGLVVHVVRSVDGTPEPITSRAGLQRLAPGR